MFVLAIIYITSLWHLIINCDVLISSGTKLFCFVNDLCSGHGPLLETIILKITKKIQLTKYLLLLSLQSDLQSATAHAVFSNMRVVKKLHLILYRSSPLCIGLIMDHEPHSPSFFGDMHVTLKKKLKIKLNRQHYKATHKYMN
jgi:hypothetical protein